MAPESDWPSEELRDQLVAINRELMRNSEDAVLRGGTSWPNRQRELYDEELADAHAHFVHPLKVGTTEFEILMSSGVRFNWAIQLDGTLRVSPSVAISEDGPTRISHAILAADGGDVLAAGEGRAGDFLSHTTGHYKNPVEVVAPVKRAFEKIGVAFRR